MERLFALMNKAFAILLLAVASAAGCGGPSVSPIIEYNAAIQALDRNIKQEDDLAGVARTGSTPEVRKQAQEALERIKKTNERLRTRIREISQRI